VLDEAVTALADDPALSVTIDGHTCNIGTAEYTWRSPTAGRSR